MTPALVNVALNYKVCVEQGLPLHPTHYFELGERQVAYPESMVAGAQAFFVEAIDAALAVFALDESATARIASLAADIPDGVGDFVYTSTRDTYTWRASEPARIASLAADVRASVKPVLVVGAAHGAITAALVLASLLRHAALLHQAVDVQTPRRRACDRPERPAPSWRATAAARFCSSTRTSPRAPPSRCSRRLGPLFEESYSASVLRHGGASFDPHFVGRTWYE